MTGDALASGAGTAVLRIVAIVACAISIVCIVVTIAVNGGARTLRETLPSQILLHLCGALLAGLVLFLLASLVTSDAILCRVWGVSMHYFWLAAALWTTMQVAQLYVVVVIVAGYKATRHYLVYRLIAWGMCTHPIVLMPGVPAIIVGATVGIAGVGVYGGSDLYGPFVS